MRKLSSTVHFHFVRLTAPDDMGDRWSDDHIGMVVIRCRSQAGQIIDSERYRSLYKIINNDRVEQYMITI